MKIRTDFVTNSSSSSYTVVQLESPALSNWLKSTKTTMTRFCNKIASDIVKAASDTNSDGVDIDYIINLKETGSVVGLLLHLLDQQGEENSSLAQFLQEHREEIDTHSSAKVYCTYRFECNPPEVARVIFRNGSANAAYCSFEEFDEIVLEEIVPDYFDNLDGFSTEEIDQILALKSTH